jgi:hypothetical protein
LTIACRRTGKTLPSLDDSATSSLRHARAEKLLRALVGVAEAFVCEDRDGRFHSIYIVPELNAQHRQVQRNVASALIVAFGMRIHPDAVHVVPADQVPDELRAAEPAEATASAAAPATAKTDAGSSGARQPAAEAATREDPAPGARADAVTPADGPMKAASPAPPPKAPPPPSPRAANGSGNGRHAPAEPRPAAAPAARTSRLRSATSGLEAHDLWVPPERRAEPADDESEGRGSPRPAPRPPAAASRTEAQRPPAEEVAEPAAAAPAPAEDRPIDDAPAPDRPAAGRDRTPAGPADEPDDAAEGADLDAELEGLMRFPSAIQAHLELHGRSPGELELELDGVDLHRDGVRVFCTVRIRFGQDLCTAGGQAVDTPGAEIPLAARLAVEAIRTGDISRGLTFDGATLTQIGARMHVAVSIQSADGKTPVSHAGIAPVSARAEIAAAAAVLDALRHT